MLEKCCKYWTEQSVTQKSCQLKWGGRVDPSRRRSGIWKEKMTLREKSAPLCFYSQLEREISSSPLKNTVQLNVMFTGNGCCSIWRRGIFWKLYQCGSDFNRHVIPRPQNGRYGYAPKGGKDGVLIGGWDPIPTCDSTAAVILFSRGTNDPRITKFYL